MFQSSGSNACDLRPEIEHETVSRVSFFKRTLRYLQKTTPAREKADLQQNIISEPVPVENKIEREVEREAESLIKAPLQ